MIKSPLGRIALRRKRTLFLIKKKGSVIMKRMTAMLLAWCLVFRVLTGSPLSVYGASPADAADFAAAETQGILEVEIRPSRLFPFQGNVTVKISGNGMQPEEQKLQFDRAAVSAKTAEFHLSEGEYEVLVKTPGFADYKQSVQVENGWISKILACSAKVETGSFAVSGWLRPGDVNGDGDVDRKDADVALAAVRLNAGNEGVDVNGDGRTDLADLQSVAQSMGDSRESGVEKLAIVSGAQLEEGTVAEGSLEDFWNRSGAIALKPQDASLEISEENPVGIEFVLAGDDALARELSGIVIHTPEVTGGDGRAQSEIADGEAVVSYIDESGNEWQEVFSLSAQSAYAMRRSAARISSGADGALILDFGMQIAVKRVTIRITGTRKTEPLVNIAQVEFVNNMEEYIPAPMLDIPTLNAPVAQDASITVSWNRQNNITGYEVFVSGPVKNQSGNETQIVRVSGTQHRISSINNKPLKNFAKYTLKVRSVNGDWHSPWSNEQTGEPKPGRLPAPPDNVKAEGGYRSIRVSWKDMDDANGYMVYYKKTQGADGEYRPAVDGFALSADGAGKLNDVNYMIGGLDDATEYSVYVIGWNELGWGRPSLVSTAETKSMTPPVLPNYKLLNTSNGAGKLSAHITNAMFGGSGNARMIGSALDTEDHSALGLVDNDYGSYWMKEDWDDGVAYPTANLSKGFVIELDEDYQINYITFAAADQKAALQYVRIGYWNLEHGSERQSVGARLISKTDANKNPYYIIKLDHTVMMNKVYICLGRDSSRAAMMVGEVHFHKYDSLEDDIMDLYADDMHATLREEVTEETIRALEERLEAADAESGEKHPLYQELALELKTAREILGANLEAAYVVDNRITARKDGHLGFGGLNAWQPLGKAANAGDALLVYVGHNALRTGDSASLQLVFAQQHAESSALARTVSLKVGRNEITVPQIATTDYEKGGQIYVAYTGNSPSDQYAVRISGGISIPVLNVYGKTGSERTEAIRAYVSQLESYVASIETEHAGAHAGTRNEHYGYDPKNCILNATDIMMREMMYSLPATQVWAGIRNASDKVAKLDLALQAMEQAMALFYQHKGLSDAAGTSKGNNALPAQHLNIRYMRMFAGAFMYASGNHIGIEWGSATLAGVSDWSEFGWGIAHEIGHNINQGSYAVAEVTNNYYAQLLTGKQRFKYKDVYDKVTSGTKGRAANVFTQLAMYWQLHLAFDDSADDRQMFGQYEDLFDNVFFARADTYARNPAKAPKAGLSLNGGADQNLMRLACAASGKNILSFFERWGMTPDEATLAYAAQYELETKALCYVNEDARDYRISHPGEAGTVKGRDAVATASVTANSNQAQIMVSTNEDADLILGYEISRSMTSNGEKKTEVIGFAPTDSGSAVYVDTVSSINNRVLEYEVRAVDKYLNYSNVKSAGSVKIQTEGILDKSMWTAQTTLTSEDDTAIEPDEEDPDSGYNQSAPGNVAAKQKNSIAKIVDGDKTETGTYRGNGGKAATIKVDMHKAVAIDALKYDGDAQSGVTVEVSEDGAAWVTVKENCVLEDGENTVWFDAVEDDAREDFIGTYVARYVRLSIPDAGSVCIREIDICAPSGDNLEFMAAGDGQPAIGRLEEDYQYGSRDEDVIPRGSLIFTGTYKGNPAYNVVVLYDMEGNVIGEKDGSVFARQVIFADAPKHGNLGETSDGTWVYYVEPGRWNEESIQNLGSVRGELYRVDNALTLAGERIVSDTQAAMIPDSIPIIRLGGRNEALD